MLSSATLAAILGTLIVSASCNKSEGGDVAPAAGSASPSAAKPGSGGGFSADLAKEIGAGSGGKPGEAVGSAAAMAGSDGAKAGAAKAGSAAATTASGDAAKAGDAKAAVATPSGKPAATASTPATAPPATPVAVVAHGPVKVPSDLAAIKLSLLPNWDRDVDEAGTFQYVVRIKGTQSTKTFSFRYGYDDPKAPTDREQYKKYLVDTKAMSGEIKDRQRGAAWFLEGGDASGAPSFRYVVLYGGKRLICYGSLYKDNDSNRLGDDRDQTVIQAKQICETLAL